MPVTDHSLSLAITCWFCPGVLWLSWGSGEQTEGRLCQFLLSGTVNSLHRWWTASAQGSARLYCLQPLKGEVKADIIFSYNTACNVSVLSKWRQHGFTGGKMRKKLHKQLENIYLFEVLLSIYQRNQKCWAERCLLNKCASIKDLLP